MAEPEIIDAEIVAEAPTAALATVPRLAVTPSVKAEELVERLSVIRQAMSSAMQEGVDYGRIPGVDKPTLLKPGSEKLGVLFQLDIQLENTETWGPGDHLRVRSKATVYHAPTGARLGSGEGLCSTRERKYAYRQQGRSCPSCGAAAIIKGKAEYGGGWVCFKKKNGCGAKFPDGDQSIEGQPVGDTENPDLPDQWNTVLKMAEKRGRIDAVLAVTGASALFTQDMEDNAPPAPPEPPNEAAPFIREAKVLVRRNNVKTAELRVLMRSAGIEIADGANVLVAVDALSVAQALALIRVLGDVRVVGGSDVPSDASEFRHPAGDEGDAVPFDPSVAS